VPPQLNRPSYPQAVTEVLVERLQERRRLAAERTAQQQLIKNMARYRGDPERYAADVLHVNLTPDQGEILRSIVTNRFTAVKASHGVGKTFDAAIAANYWYDCWDAHIVYVTAPTWAQAIGLTFKEIKGMRRANGLPGVILETGLVRDKDKNRDGAHYIRALNAERGEGFQGEHSADILVILEEAVGVPGYIWEAVGGLVITAECRVLAIGNPTDDANRFGVACEDPKYNVISISALNHPNIEAELQCQPAPYPKAIRLQWLYEMLDSECEILDSHAEDSFTYYDLASIKLALEGQPLPPVAARDTIYQPTAYFQGRALGEFPTQADQQVIPKGWIRDLPVLYPGEADIPEVGCDIARFGDDRTVDCIRWGPCVFKLKEIRKLDTTEVADQLKQDAEYAAGLYNGSGHALHNELTGDIEGWLVTVSDGHGGTQLVRRRPVDLISPKRIPIKIDTTGGLGAGPYDTLRREGYNAVAINSSEHALNQEQYPNRRSELWFDVRDRAKEKRLDLSRLPKDMREKLIRELGAPQYAIKSGKKTVEEKPVTKKRLGSSPDLADGHNLAFAIGRGRPTIY
jgi:hypothetical protein